MPNETYTPSQMAAAIASIGQAALQTKTATQNGTVTPDTGYDGLSEVTVNVPNPNYVETYSGTLATVFANLTMQDFVGVPTLNDNGNPFFDKGNKTIILDVESTINTGERATFIASAYISEAFPEYQVEATMVISFLANRSDSKISYLISGATEPESDAPFAISSIGPSSNGVLTALAQQTLSRFNATLTIIHHPLPSA